MSGISFLWLFGVVACLLFHLTSSAPTLDCAHVMANGEYVGKIIGIIDKDRWSSTNYLFKPVGADVACFEYKGSENLGRSKLLLTAFLTNAIIKINIKGNWVLDGIAFGS